MQPYAADGDLAKVSGSTRVQNPDRQRLKCAANGFLAEVSSYNTAFACPAPMMNTHHRLPDTRPYPTDPVKNELLLHAGHLAAGRNKAQMQLARESLHASLATMLHQGHYLGLSVALALAPDAATYHALWQSLGEVLDAQHEDEIQWLALPVVVVAGCQQAGRLPGQVPDAAALAVLTDTDWGGVLHQAHWLPQLLDAATLADIKADAWFAAKQNRSAAEALASRLAAAPAGTDIEAGQSVRVLYALAYGPPALKTALNRPLGDAALPLMQMWQQHLATAGITLFANPLPPLPPLAAIAQGGALRLRMAGDVFATNAIRAIRLQSPRVGVVIAAQAGGRLLIGFNATDSAFELTPQVFAWPLSPMADLDSVVQNWLELLAECQVEHIRLLHEALPEQAELPTYAEAQTRPGHNPLFAEHH